MKGFLATRLKCFITQNVLYYSIVSSHRAVITDYKVARLLTPAQIDTYVIHNTRKHIKTDPTFISCKFLIADSMS